MTDKSQMQPLTAMLFAPKSASSWLSIDALDGVSVEFVDTYKYLGFWLDRNLNFKHHIKVLTKKLKFTLGFLYRLKCCFSTSSRKRLVSGLFLSQLDYGDNIYIFACPTVLAKFDPLYMLHCVIYQMHPIGLIIANCIA